MLPLHGARDSIFQYEVTGVLGLEQSEVCAGYNSGGYLPAGTSRKGKREPGRWSDRSVRFNTVMTPNTPSCSQGNNQNADSQRLFTRQQVDIRVVLLSSWVMGQHGLSTILSITMVGLLKLLVETQRVKARIVSGVQWEARLWGNSQSVTELVRF